MEWYSEETKARMAAEYKEQTRLKFGCPKIWFYKKRAYWYLVPSISISKTFKGHPMINLYFLNKELFIRL